MPDLLDRQNNAVGGEQDAIVADTQPQPLNAFQHFHRPAMGRGVGRNIEQTLFDPLPPYRVDLGELPRGSRREDNIHLAGVAFR